MVWLSFLDAITPGSFLSPSSLYADPFAAHSLLGEQVYTEIHTDFGSP